MLVNLPHIGRWNVDRIVRITAYPAKWDHGPQRPKVRREFIWWGKPYRDRDPWAYLRPASIRVWSGSGYDDYIEYYCKPGEPERWRDDVLAAIAAAQAAPQAERIVAAAVRRCERNKAWHAGQEGAGPLQDWVTYVMPPPARHHTILWHMRGDDVVGPHEQGFITSTGRWVDRQTAMGIAVAAGQVSPAKVTAPRLFSEDLW